MEFEIVSRDGFTWTVEAKAAQLLGDNLTLLDQAAYEGAGVRELTPVAVFPAGGWFSCVAVEAERFTGEQVNERIDAALADLRDQVEAWRADADLDEATASYDKVIGAIDRITGDAE